LSGRHTKNPSSSTSNLTSGTAPTSQVTAGKRTVSTGKSVSTSHIRFGCLFQSLSASNSADPGLIALLIRFPQVLSPNRSTPQSSKRADLTSKIANLETQNAQLSRHLTDLTADAERTEQALVERDVLVERVRERCKGLEKEVGGWSKRLEQRVSRGQGDVEKVEPDGSEIDGP
jgi:peptidoglycan hydrolase CwlO-like protein